MAPNTNAYSTALKELVEKCYRESDLVLDIIFGKIPTARIADETHLCSLFVHRKEAVGVTLAHLVKYLMDTDAYRTLSKCGSYLDIIWPNRTDRITSSACIVCGGISNISDSYQSTRYSSKAVRRYLLSDVLERQYIMSGKSDYPEVDQIIVANRRSRLPGGAFDSIQ